MKRVKYEIKKKIVNNSNKIEEKEKCQKDVQNRKKNMQTVQKE